MAMESSYKRLKLSSRNLCVICTCIYNEVLNDYSSDRYHIFIVDLNGDASEEYVQMQPTIRLLGNSLDYLFCGLGRDLYIFKGTSVYKYNLEEHDTSSCLVLDETSMKNIKVSSMPYYNHFMKTIATPDGKIIVLSTSIYFYYPQNEEFYGKSHSQVFDPTTNEWGKLPELCIRPAARPAAGFEILDGCGSWKIIPESSTYNRPWGSRGHHFTITQFGFVNESTLLVRIMYSNHGLEGCLLTLDIHSLNQGWKLYDGPDYSYSIDEKLMSFNKLLIVENSLFLKAHGGSSCSGVDFKFPRVMEFWRRASIDVVLTDYVEDRECSLANIFSSPYYIDSCVGSSTLVVDEFKYDLRQGICTSKISTPFKFRVQAEGCHLFVVNESFMLSRPPYPFKRLTQGEGNRIT